MGLLKAKELLLTGRWINSDEALKIGLLSEVVDDPKQRASGLAVELAALPSISLSSSKASLERSVFPNLETRLQDEVNVANYCFAQSDAAKAFTDFAARKRGINGGLIPVNETAAKAKQAVVKASQPDSALHSPRHINAALQLAVDNFPDRTFLRFNGKDVTFEQFDSSMSKLAGGLRNIGIVPGDRVLVMMRNSIEMLEIWMAVNRLGAVWVPINVEIRSVTLKHVISAAGPKMVVVDKEFSTLFAETGILSNDSVYVNEPNVPDDLKGLYTSGSTITTSHPVTPSTTAAFLYTSGTTGKSKPCILSHEYFILQAQALIDGCGLRPDDVLFCPFPLFHADATALTTVPAIMLGATQQYPSASALVVSGTKLEAQVLLFMVSWARLSPCSTNSHPLPSIDNTTFAWRGACQYHHGHQNMRRDSDTG